MHEASLCDANSFATFTYSPEFLPADLSLNPVHFTDFLKRARYHFGPFRYFMCGEYGERYSRPHYHALLFGLWPSDCKPSGKSAMGAQYYRSDKLDAVWGFGRCLVGNLSFESAAYVARYCVKVNDPRNKYVEIVDPTTGFMPFYRHREYGRASNRPGIGASWIDKYMRSVYPVDRVVAREVACRPPRYYDKRKDLSDVGGMWSVKAARVAKRPEYALGSPEFMMHEAAGRLRVAETIAKSRLSLFKRDME